MVILKKPGKIFGTIDWNKPLSYEVRLAEDFGNPDDGFEEYLWHESTTRKVESVTLLYSDGTRISLARTGTREMPGPGGKYDNSVTIAAYNPAAIVQLAHWILEKGKPQYIDAGGRNQHIATLSEERESDTPGLDSWDNFVGGRTEFKRMEQLLVGAARKYMEYNKGIQVSNPWQGVTSTFYDMVVPSKLEDVTMRLLISDGVLRFEPFIYTRPTDQFVASEKKEPVCILDNAESVSIRDLHEKLIHVGIEPKLENVSAGTNKIFNQDLKCIRALYSIGSHRVPSELRSNEYEREKAIKIASEIGDFPFKIKDFTIELPPEKLVQKT